MLSQDLRYQRFLMNQAVGWLNKIENCDLNIAAGNKVLFYKGVRTEAIEKYADVMSKLIGQAIEISKVLVA